jgi:ribonucleotide reductase alpha subunit
MDPFIQHRFKLSPATVAHIKTLVPNFGFNGFGEAVYYRTYSRKKPDGSQEDWADTLIRVTEGIISIRKDHHLKHHLSWNDADWQDFARSFLDSMFHMEFLPPGRGLWACGTDFMYQHGSAALNNCGACTTKDLVLGSCWLFSMLMNGCGVGSDTAWEGKALRPNKEIVETFVIPDSREGWVESIQRLLQAYLPNASGQLRTFPRFDYSKIRPRGAPIKGFGGTASGPEPLMKLHQRVEAYLDAYLDYPLDPVESFVTLVRKLRRVDYAYYDDAGFDKFVQTVADSARKYPELKQYNAVRCAVDITNAIGACVVAGNIRRSSELILGKPHDKVFLNLKNHTVNPEREVISWMSNNTVKLSQTEDFSFIPEIAERIRDNGEPGIYNQLNVTRYGRIGHRHDPHDRWTRELEEDQATLCNPCITGDTLVLTTQGWKQVSELQGLEFTAIVDGKPYLSTNRGFWYTGTKQVYQLTLKNGLTLKATADHEIYTLNRGKVPLIELTRTDQIAVPNNSGNKTDSSDKLTAGLKSPELTKVEMSVECPDIGILQRLQLQYLEFGIPSHFVAGKLVFDPQTETRSYHSTMESVQLLGEEEVFDCTIEEVHAFNANGIKISNCSEIPLEPFELCNLAEVFPTRCLVSLSTGPSTKDVVDEKRFLEALRFATFYSSTVSLLPTHWDITNAVIARNRRIGVSLSGIADLYDIIGFTELTRLVRAGYKVVREENTRLAHQAGVPPSIRVTTMKPSGSISQLVGVSSGLHFPTFRHAIRRMRVSEDSPIVSVLQAAGYPWEKDVYSDNTLVFEFPIDQGKTRSAEEVSMWEQFSLMATLGREFADNMISCTIYFSPEKEGSDIERAIAQYAPVIKSVSMLPHSKKGAYRQSPYEGITKEEYEAKLAKIKPIDWHQYRGSDGQMPKFCTNDSCTL